MSYATAVREFIVDNFLFGEEGDLQNDSPFFETGIVDSTGILEVVTFLEETYNISVADEELVPENFTSINTIDNYLKSKLNGKQN
jgi:acyl carrier protein